MSKEEVKQLRAFLRLKQIFAPNDMTNDEIKIGNKLFSQLDIERINAERPGFNFPWAVIISVLTAGLSLFLMYISPCFGFLGAGTGMLSATVISMYVLTRISATKLDKILSVVAIILSIGAFIAYQSHFKGNTWELKDDESQTKTNNSNQEINSENNYSESDTTKSESSGSSSKSYCSKHSMMYLPENGCSECLYDDVEEELNKPGGFRERVMRP
jgi:hypothetical protein